MNLNIFQPLELKPVPLSNSEADDYLLALKQEFRGIMQESAYFIKPNVVKKGMIYKRDFINSFKYVFLCDYYFLDNVYNLMD